METKVWERLPEDVLHSVLARLPIKALGKMRSVSKQWNDLLSSRDTLQVKLPNWSLHSTPGFLIQIHWDLQGDVEYWGVEGGGSAIYKVPLLNHVVVDVVDTCKGIFCCHRKGDQSDLLMGIPGTKNWRRLPRPPAIPATSFTFSGMTFDASTRRCILLLGYSYSDRDRTNVMCIYDSESNAWTQVSTIVPDHIRPCGKGIYCKGKFHWATLASNRNLIVAFNIVDGLWTEMAPPKGCTKIFPGNLCEHDGQLAVLQLCATDRRDSVDLHMWMLNEAEKNETWCKLSPKGHFPLYSAVHPTFAVNKSGLIIVVDWKMNMSINISIFNSKGKLIFRKMGLPDLHTYQRQRQSYISVSPLETTNVWWP